MQQPHTHRCYDNCDESGEAEIQWRAVVVLHKLSLQLCIVKLAEFLEHVAHVDPTLQAATTWWARNTFILLVLRGQKVSI